MHPRAHRQMIYMLYPEINYMGCDIIFFQYFGFILVHVYVWLLDRVSFGDRAIFQRVFKMKVEDIVHISVLWSMGITFLLTHFLFKNYFYKDFIEFYFEKTSAPNLLLYLLSHSHWFSFFFFSFFFPSLSPSPPLPPPLPFLLFLLILLNSGLYPFYIDYI